MLALASDERAAILLGTVSRAQRLDSQSPRTISLAREPAGWLRLLGDSTHPLSKSITESNWYLAWPGRPPMNPPHKLRALTAAEQGLFDRGRFLYSDCKACHGEDGKGVQGQAPPLAGSSRVQGPVTQLARVLLHGFEGTIQREGVAYSGVMAPAPRSNDGDLAALMTYVRRAWGNGGDPVTEGMVTQVRMLTARRDRPWRTEELEVIK
jgi:mono/diheme cytochrome c family protein